MLCGLASVNGLIALVGTSFGLHSMVVVGLGDFAGVGGTGFVEGFVFLGLHWKRGFSLVVQGSEWVSELSLWAPTCKRAAP